MKEMIINIYLDLSDDQQIIESNKFVNTINIKYGLHECADRNENLSKKSRIISLISYISSGDGSRQNICSSYYGFILSTSCWRL